MPPLPSAGFDVRDFIYRMYHEVWNWRLLNRLPDCYAPNLRFHGATDREYYSLGNYKSFILSLMATFPNLALEIDDFYYMGNDHDGYITSVRWSIVGSHRGNGIYGELTNRPIRMWGISQHLIREGRIIEEWMIFNELALLSRFSPGALRRADCRVDGHAGSRV